MQITKLVNIEGYAAGRNGNLLVVLDDLKQDRIYKGKKRENEIRSLLCLAIVTDPNTLAKFKKYVDKKTPYNRVIVVSKKFTKLFKKTQHILLMEKNFENSIIDSSTSDEEIKSYGRIMAMATYSGWFWKMRCRNAFDKARTYSERDENKAARDIRRRIKANDGKISDYSYNKALDWGEWNNESLNDIDIDDDLDSDTFEALYSCFKDMSPEDKKKAMDMANNFFENEEDPIFDDDEDIEIVGNNAAAV